MVCIGFSAGGYLSAYEAITNKSMIDVLILLYPVISMKDGKTNINTRESLLGTNPSQYDIKHYSLEDADVNEICPTIIFCGANDYIVNPYLNGYSFFYESTICKCSN